MSDLTTAEDRCRGVLVGLAVGDQFGGPIRMAEGLAENAVDLPSTASGPKVRLAWVAQTLTGCKGPSLEPAAPCRTPTSCPRPANHLASQEGERRTERQTGSPTRVPGEGS
jgi:hypothetical protein